jgi:AcrR family transcriptional regulator
MTKTTEWRHDRSFPGSPGEDPHHLSAFAFVNHGLSHGFRGATQHKMTVAPRKRLSPEESRDAALEAARELLLEAGPQAVTLKAVAAKIGRTHANLLHHFGSAAGLQKALAASIADGVTSKIGAAVQRARAGADHDDREVVNMTFDAFDKGGAGALASWMILTGNQDALDPILEAIHRLMDELAEGHDDKTHSLHEETLQLVLMALGDALLGAPMARALGLPRDKAREIAAAQLSRTMEEHHHRDGEPHP